MVTLDDVAARAGVSRMTVSNALRGKAIVRPETARRVREAAEALGYRPNIAARQLSSGRTHIIGLAMADLDYIFPADLAACVSDQATKRGYQVIIQQTRLSHDYERQMLASPAVQICDGTILCWTSSNPSEMEDFGKSHPLVLFDGFEAEGRCDCVFTPAITGMAAAVRHLIEQGCRRILILGDSYLPPEEFAAITSPGGRRIRGAAEALLDAGLPYSHETVIPCPWTRPGGYQTVRRLIEQQYEFDGLCCITDPIAIGALKALLDAGLRIPQDVAITGFDGVADGQYLTPGLTTIAVDPNEVAKLCLDLLIERIEAATPPTPRTIIARHTLKQRGSAERGGD